MLSGMTLAVQIQVVATAIAGSEQIGSMPTCFGS
jgi:hypothetical protein